MLLDILTLLVPVLVLLAGLAYLLRDLVDRLADTFGGGAAGAGAGGEATTQGLPHDALRLQACERYTLLLERIAVPNLLLRIPPGADGTARAYVAALLLAIRQEMEHNVTQQIYISDNLWGIIAQARDNVSLLITRAAEGADTAPQVADRLRLMSSRQPEDAIRLAQAAVRREASSVLGQ